MRNHNGGEVREWWLERKNIFGDYWEAYEEFSPGTIPVIEKHHYTALLEKCKRLEGALEKTMEFLAGDNECYCDDAEVCPAPPCLFCVIRKALGR